MKKYKNIFLVLIIILILLLFLNILFNIRSIKVLSKKYTQNLVNTVAGFTSSELYSYYYGNDKERHIYQINLQEGINSISTEYGYNIDITVIDRYGSIIAGISPRLNGTKYTDYNNYPDIVDFLNKEIKKKTDEINNSDLNNEDKKKKIERFTKYPLFLFKKDFILKDNNNLIYYKPLILKFDSEESIYSLGIVKVLFSNQLVSSFIIINIIISITMILMLIVLLALIILKKDYK